MKKFVYFFDEGKKEMKSLLGGKGANLAEMKILGLPVPDGFTISTEACISYYDHDKSISDELKDQINQNMKRLEDVTGKGLGSDEYPLLVSVRSGAAISMPGMMDTILNLGLNDTTTERLGVLTGNMQFAYDSYRRFIQMYSDVVLEIPKFEFDRIVEGVLKEKSIENAVDLDVDSLKTVIDKFKELVKSYIKEEFPTEPKKQLYLAIEAVFKSWNNPRAKIYREINEIPDNIGTAVNIQSMVFGNMGNESGTGVAFTRNPSTGENVMYGEYLLNAQGEDVVAGIRTPNKIEEMEKQLPEVYRQFIEITEVLERHYRDMQDIEFTIENKKLYFLQTRTGKRTAKAAIKIACDMVEEGLINKEEAVLRVTPEQIEIMLHPKFDKDDLKKASILTKGLPASPGAATGKVVFTAEEVVEAHKNGEKTILVRVETSPEDIEGMVYSEGILTSRGGMTSHAAVVARGMGKCCIAGCGEVYVEEHFGQFKVKGTIISRGDYISLDGNTGLVYQGEIKTETAEFSGEFGTILNWADEFKNLAVRTNADTPNDIKTAIEFGAEGIGLCRTEHMFFDDARILAVREMIVSKTHLERKHALMKLLPYQKQDFIDMLKVLEGRPINIRLLDPPLHEFLPNTHEDIVTLSKDLNMDIHKLETTIEELKEVNPMLGHRGCRLAITYPEIYEMQVKAIFEAAKACIDDGIAPNIEIMIPLVGLEKEISMLRELVIKTAEEVMNRLGFELDYQVGTMIEIPRAALTADTIAKHADFFSFGTNDLTQMTLGFSRDDSGKFIGEYKSKDIFEKDPFERIDFDGVGKLMKIARDLGRSTKADLKIGICGEQGGESKSIDFCDELGLNYVSCSPFRVPVARLAAGQAAIKRK